MQFGKDTSSMHGEQFGAQSGEMSLHGEEGIILGQKISHSRIEVDKAKNETIEKLPPMISTKDIRSSLGYVSFYRRFIKDF